MNVGFVQQVNQREQAINLADSIRQIGQLASQGAALVVLQELHTSHYFCQTQNSANFKIAEPLVGPTFRALSAAAKQHKLVVVGSIFEQRHAGVYHNTAIVIDSDGSLAGFYRKMHIPDDPGYYEKYYFIPGDTGFKPITTSLGKLGVCICWDQWFPESARLMALAGAELLIFPSAIGWDCNDCDAEKQRQLDAWITIQRSHAIANHLPVIAVNRAGYEADPSGHTAGIDFWGSSFICDAMGTIRVQADSRQASALLTSIDLQATQQQRNTWPFFRDRRIDAYQDLCKRWRDD